MAQDKGKNIAAAPPMNPPPRLLPIPFGEFHGCDGDGCASDRDTWPLHHAIRRGEHCRLCCSCVLLSNRSLYCCRCFFLVTTPSCHYDHGDEFMAPPAPTVTCHVCREAVAHVPCLYPEPAAAGGVFVCPPCAAAQNGTPFTYAPSCRQAIDERGGRVLVLAARMALALLQRHATAASAAAERLAQEARDARAIAREAITIANELCAKEDPSWVVPPSPENDLLALAAPEEEEEEGIEDVGEVLLVRRNALPMPPLDKLTISTGDSVVPPPPPPPVAPAEAKHAPSSSQSKQLFDLNENNAVDLNEKSVDLEAVQTEPKRQHVLLNSFNVKEMAMVAAEAARASPPTPQTLQLFPGTKASSSTMMPRTKKARSKRPRTLQLFKDGEKKM